MVMTTRQYTNFLKSEDTLRVYARGKLVFSSRKDRLLALLDYFDGFASRFKEVTIMDKIVGNAAALLAIKANCREIYSPLGSQIAVETLDKYGVSHHFDRIVPFICQENGKDMCPMEKLSLNKTPEEFYQIIKSTATNPKRT